MPRNLLSRSRTNDSNNPFADDVSGIDHGDVALQDMPRLSTETQRRNGYVQSNSANRGDRILEDIKNGNYYCTICSDLVVTESGFLKVWHCKDCFNIFHVDCVKEWAKKDGARSFTVRWKCAICARIQEGAPKASCWCGKEPFNIHNAVKPNSCDKICGKASKCSHGNPAEKCVKTCHPGPCDSSCRPICLTHGGSQVSGHWHRIKARFAERKPGTVSNMVLLFTLIAVIYAGIGVFVSYRIKWNTQPYRYPNFAEKYGTTVLLCSALLNVIGALGGVIGIIFFRELASLLNKLLDLSPGGRPRSSRKILAKVFGAGFLGLLAAGIIVLPLIGLNGGPSIAWYNQMRDSCQGYDTRISLDIYDEATGLSSSRPAMKFDIKSLPNLDGWSSITGQKQRRSQSLSNKHNQTFYLATHTIPVYDSVAPFQHYYRLSGFSRFSRHIAVDVDLENRQWRMMELMNTDSVNRYLAGQYESNASRKAPKFKKASERLSKNGTFTDVSPTSHHMEIPALNLTIANMYEFITSCNQEPFLRVFNNEWKLNGGDGGPDKMWSSKDQRGLVMRTASFGHMRQRLDMCVKELGKTDADGIFTSSIEDNHLVPMAIITAIRLKLWETNRRSFSCSV